LPEVAGENAIFVDPYSVESIAAGIREALGAEHNPRPAQKHARSFTWESTVDQILETLFSVANSRQRLTAESR
jgi:glycosyltransferase involved in cell wall biosynthesis